MLALSLVRLLLAWRRRGGCWPSWSGTGAGPCPTAAVSRSVACDPASVASSWKESAEPAACWMLPYVLSDSQWLAWTQPSLVAPVGSVLAARVREWGWCKWQPTLRPRMRLQRAALQGFDKRLAGGCADGRSRVNYAASRPPLTLRDCAWACLALWTCLDCSSFGKSKLEWPDTSRRSCGRRGACRQGTLTSAWNRSPTCMEIDLSGRQMSP